MGKGRSHMITVKQMERAWNARQYERLYRDLVAFRPEATLRMDFESGWAAPAAAMALIRMDELSQSHAPLFGKLLRALIATQQPDGGWGDVTTTALCLRALLCGDGHGLAVEQGLAFLAKLQRPNGLWPQLPHHRLPEDANASAAVLHHLGDQPAFQASVQLADALAWFELNETYLDHSARELWNRASRRCRLFQAA
jgi:hypothetical protein